MPRPAMDNLQPPEGLLHLWLDQPPEKETAEQIVTRLLREARRHERRAHAADIAVIVLCALLLPMVLLIALALLDEAPLAAAGWMVWDLLMVVALIMYRRYFRSLGEEPPPNATSRQYAGHSIEYLNRRERFLVKSATPISAFLAVAGILFVYAEARGQQQDVWLVAAVLCCAAQPVSWWWILRMQRKYSARRMHLRELLADLDRPAV